MRRNRERLLAAAHCARECSGRKEGQQLWRHAHSAFGKTLDGQRRGAHIGAAVSRAWLEAGAGSPTGGAWQTRPRGRSSGGHSDSRPSSAWDARVSRGSVGDWALPQKEAERVGAEAGTGREGTRPHGAGQRAPLLLFRKASAVRAREFALDRVWGEAPVKSEPDDRA